MHIYILLPIMTNLLKITSSKNRSPWRSSYTHSAKIKGQDISDEYWARVEKASSHTQFEVPDVLPEASFKYCLQQHLTEYLMEHKA